MSGTKPGETARCGDHRTRTTVLQPRQRGRPNPGTRAKSRDSTETGRGARGTHDGPGPGRADARQGVQLGVGGGVEIDRGRAAGPARPWSGARGQRGGDRGTRRRSGELERHRLKARCGPMAASRPGPTPGTRSSPASPPNGPCASRSATIVLASARPTRGSRASSAAVARSASIRSSGPERPGQCEHAVAMGEAETAAAERARSWTSPGGCAGTGEPASGRPGPTSPGESSRSSARRSAADMAHDSDVRARSGDRQMHARRSRNAAPAAATADPRRYFLSPHQRHRHVAHDLQARGRSPCRSCRPGVCHEG